MNGVRSQYLDISVQQLLQNTRSDQRFLFILGTLNAFYQWQRRHLDVIYDVSDMRHKVFPFTMGSASEAFPQPGVPAAVQARPNSLYDLGCVYGAFLPPLNIDTQRTVLDSEIRLTSDSICSEKASRHCHFRQQCFLYCDASSYTSPVGFRSPKYICLPPC